MATLRREHSAIVSGEPEEVLQGVSVAVAGLPKYTITSGGAGTLVLTRRFYASWRIVVAVILFPIGLLALITRDIETVTVTVTVTQDSPGRTRLTFGGIFTGKLIDALNSVVTSRTA